MLNGLNIKKLEFFKDVYTDCLFITSIKYSWQFMLNNKHHIINLLYTKLFGKRIIYLDNKEIYYSRKYTYNFNISFPLDYHNITIIQKDYFYTLKIDNIPFNNILNDLKLQKFNILEDTYKEKQRQKKLRKLNKKKNRILQQTINNFNKNENKNMHQINLNKEEQKTNGLNTINEEIINTSNKLQDESEDSKTIHDSFEMHEKAFSMLDKGLHNINNSNNLNSNLNNSNVSKNKNKFFGMRKKSIRSMKRNIKKKFKPNEKRHYKTFENINSSINEMIDIDLLGNENNISEEIINTNISRNNNNIFSSNNRSFFDKGSMTTQSN